MSSSQVQAPPPTTPTLMTENEARNWAMFAHLSSFIGYVIPFGNIFGPLIIWIAKREQSDLVNDQGREALNFQITMIILTFLFIVTIVGWLLLLPLAIFDIVITILAGLAANRGEKYRYPICFRLIT